MHSNPSLYNGSCQKKMKIDMAQDGEYFSIGSIVHCTTCYNQKIQGEVIAFDAATKMLAIKSTPVSGKSNVHDVRLINLSYVSDVKVLTESDEPPPPLTNLNLVKINSRLRSNKEEKLRQVQYVGVGVTPEGQKVFNAIVKTINEARWEGKNIVIMEEVTIRPPYGVEDVKGKDGSKVLEHVKKIVIKHLKEEAQKSTDPRKSMSPSPVSSISSS
ncbi:hypothetical protein KUTeg_008800 [Tegillarca granosa]|uniref:AD domain-containing protein n=1 Tax=Tegillarca granosa TaxID=220873 RepID=A0ABQ9FA73_TEGGR|nr:hypothetical protein KUTeg_008800 [Tegillarca granosa]